MTADTCGQAFFSYVFDGFLYNVCLVVLNEVVTGGTVDIYRVSAAIDDLIDAGSWSVFVGPKVDYGLDFADACEYNR